MREECVENGGHKTWYPRKLGGQIERHMKSFGICGDLQGKDTAPEYSFGGAMGVLL